MTTTDREDIITVLQAHHDMLGVDKRRMKELIRVLSRTYVVDPVKNPNVSAIIAAVESVTNTPLIQMQVRRRHRPITEARQLLAYAIKHNSRMTLEQIGEVMGRDHATVIHCLRTVDNNPRIFSDRIKEIQTRLNPPSASDKNQTR
jgi:chromosomal replication initiation ATPase DnaA